MYTYNATTKTYQFEFKNRIEYLAFRSWWKLTYLTLSDEIRAHKKNLEQSEREYKRRQARGMMQAIEKAKELARKQYEHQRIVNDLLFDVA